MNRKNSSMAATLTSSGTASRKHTTMERSAGNLQQANNGRQRMRFCHW
jgi:hypothetical protein